MCYIKRSLETCPPTVTLDEAWYAPDLFFYIKEKIDANQYQKNLALAVAFYV